jgi:hypothetical protein
MIEAKSALSKLVAQAVTKPIHLVTHKERLKGYTENITLFRSNTLCCQQPLAIVIHGRRRRRSLPCCSLKTDTKTLFAARIFCVLPHSRAARVALF